MMTYEDLKEKDKDRMKNLNRKNKYGLSGKELEALAKKHQKHRKIDNEYTCSLIEYRLDCINFHSKAGFATRRRI